MPITDDSLKLILAGLEKFEGRTAYIYNDSANPPNRTVGVGCMLPDANAACRLPFHNVGAGRPATSAEIVAEFLRVKAMPGGLPCQRYRATAGTPVIELGDDDITVLGVNKLKTDFLPGLRSMFPSFDDFPSPAQCTLIDMAWNLGIGKPASAERKAVGLYGFPSLIAACNRGDWDAASQEAHVSTSRDVRNSWRADQFLAAREVASAASTSVA
jgi:GH24 family phage-related lysozyme (muramidase)